MSCKRSSDIEEVKAQFRRLDKNGNGTLNYKEFSAIFDKLGTRLGYKEKMALFRSVDTDGSGSISFEEFVDYFFSPGEQAPAAEAGALAPPAKFAALLPHSGCGCRIPDVESRAITIEQIELVVDYCKAHCTADAWVFAGGPNQGKPLSVPEISLYDICAQVIRPATVSLRVSFVEMIADEPQPPVWFVSHWWGEPHIEFLACLQQHAKDRLMSFSESPYWVCAYANNQHELSEYVTDDPNLSAFRLAMDRAEGVVSVVDKGAMCFSRIWCCFEVFTCLESNGRSERAKYDVYTAHEHLHCFTDKRGRPVGPPTRRRAVGITDGYAVSDSQWSDYKTNRESHFPEMLVERAMALQLEEAQASVASDRRHILNTIAGAASLHAEPPSQHPNYDQLNATLRGRVAASTLRRSVEAGGEALERCITALTGSRLRELQVDFGGCTVFTQDELGAVVCALDPETVEMLVLSRCGQITALPERVADFKRLQTLSLYHCMALSSLPEGLAELPELKVLNIVGCMSLSSVPRLPDTVRIVTDT